CRQERKGERPLGEPAALRNNQRDALQWLPTPPSKNRNKRAVTIISSSQSGSTADLAVQRSPSTGFCGKCMHVYRENQAQLPGFARHSSVAPRRDPPVP